MAVPEPVHDYLFNEGTGNIVHDSIGTKHGTINASVSPGWVADGIKNTARILKPVYFSNIFNTLQDNCLLQVVITLHMTEGGSGQHRSFIGNTDSDNGYLGFYHPNTTISYIRFGRNINNRHNFQTPVYIKANIPYNVIVYKKAGSFHILIDGVESPSGGWTNGYGVTFNTFCYGYYNGPYPGNDCTLHRVRYYRNIELTNQNIQDISNFKTNGVEIGVIGSDTSCDVEISAGKNLEISEIGVESFCNVELSDEKIINFDKIGTEADFNLNLSKGTFLNLTRCEYESTFDFTLSTGLNFLEQPLLRKNFVLVEENLSYEVLE